MHTHTQPKLSYIASAIFQTCRAITKNKKHYLHAQAIYKMCIVFPYSSLTCKCTVHMHMLISDKIFQNICV